MFTYHHEESDALLLILNLNETVISRTKSSIVKIVGEDNIRKVKELLSKK